MKKFVLLTVAVLMLGLLSLNVFADETINVQINNSTCNFADEVKVLNGRTMVPVTDIYTAFGASVEWNENNGTFYIYKGHDIINIGLNENVIKVNDSYIYMDTPCTMIGNHIMLPIRYAAESVKYPVVWLENTNTVLIRTEQYYSNIEIETYYSDLEGLGADISGFDITEMTLDKVEYNYDGELIGNFKITGRTFGEMKNIRFYLEFGDDSGIHLGRTEVVKALEANSSYSTELKLKIPEGTKKIKFRDFEEYVVY